MASTLETKRTVILNKLSFFNEDRNVINKLSDDNVNVVYDIIYNEIPKHSVCKTFDGDVCFCIALVYYNIFINTDDYSISDHYDINDNIYCKKIIKYYKLSISKGCTYAIVKLAKFYKEHYESEDATKYYIMALDNGFDFDNLEISDDDYNNYMTGYIVHYYVEKSKNFTELQKENENLQKKIKELQTMVDFQPGGSGYLDTEKHFEEMLPKKE
jgi:hypothetical protein